MKRDMVITVRIEISADRPTGIDQAAAEALSQLKCDFAMDCKEHGCFAARIVEKGVDTYDEEKLTMIILDVTGIDLKRFLKSKDWDAAYARNLFGFFARKYFEWDWRRISSFVGRERTGIAKGVKSLSNLIEERSGATRAKRAVEDVEKVKFKWRESKQ